MHAYVHLTDEAIVDYQLGTPEMQIAAAARLDLAAAVARVRWEALPWRIRFYRAYVGPPLREARRRIDKAWRALWGEPDE